MLTQLWISFKISLAGGDLSLAYVFIGLRANFVLCSLHRRPILTIPWGFQGRLFFNSLNHNTCHQERSILLLLQQTLLRGLIIASFMEGYFFTSSSLEVFNIFCRQGRTINGVTSSIVPHLTFHVPSRNLSLIYFCLLQHTKETECCSPKDLLRAVFYPRYTVFMLLVEKLYITKYCPKFHLLTYPLMHLYVHTAAFVADEKTTCDLVDSNLQCMSYSSAISLWLFCMYNYQWMVLLEHFLCVQEQHQRL